MIIINQLIQILIKQDIYYLREQYEFWGIFILTLESNLCNDQSIKNFHQFLLKYPKAETEISSKLPARIKINNVPYLS